MALLAYQQMAITGTTPTYTAVTAEQTMPPDDRGFLHVKNTDASANTATVVVPGTSFGQANTDVAVTVAATTGDKMIGPLVASLADPVSGLITINHSNVDPLTVSALVRI